MGMREKRSDPNGTGAMKDEENEHEEFRKKGTPFRTSGTFNTIETDYIM